MRQVKTKSRACFHALPCSLQHRTLPLCQGGLRRYHESRSTGPHFHVRDGSGATMCTMALYPASLLGSALVPPCFPWLWTLPPCWEGSGAATRPVVPYGPWASSIKKSLASLPMKLGSCVSKARMRDSKAPDARALMGLQDMRASGVINACNRCGHATIVQLQYHIGPIDHW
jgi:hypothetical protein